MSYSDSVKKPLLVAMAQACNNIIAVAEPFAAASDFVNQENAADNINMNLIIISELYAQNDDIVKEKFDMVNWPEIKRNIDLITADYRNADCKVLYHVSKSLIPRLKEFIDTFLSKS